MSKHVYELRGEADIQMVSRVEHNMELNLVFHGHGLSSSSLAWCLVIVDKTFLCQRSFKIPPGGGLADPHRFSPETTWKKKINKHNNIWFSLNLFAAQQ